MVSEVVLAIAVLCGDPKYIKNKGEDTKGCTDRLETCLGSSPDLSKHEAQDCFRKERFRNMIPKTSTVKSS